MTPTLPGWVSRRMVMMFSTPKVKKKGVRRVLRRGECDEDVYFSYFELELTTAINEMMPGWQVVILISTEHARSRAEIYKPSAVEFVVSLAIDTLAQKDDCGSIRRKLKGNYSQMLFNQFPGNQNSHLAPAIAAYMTQFLKLPDISIQMICISQTSYSVLHFASISRTLV